MCHSPFLQRGNGVSKFIRSPNNDETKLLRNLFSELNQSDSVRRRQCECGTRNTIVKRPHVGGKFQHLAVCCRAGVYRCSNMIRAAAWLLQFVHHSQHFDLHMTATSHTHQRAQPCEQCACVIQPLWEWIQYETPVNHNAHSSAKTVTFYAADIHQDSIAIHLHVLLDRLVSWLDIVLCSLVLRPHPFGSISSTEVERSLAEKGE